VSPVLSFFFLGRATTPFPLLPDVPLLGFFSFAPFWLALLSPFSRFSTNAFVPPLEQSCSPVFLLPPGKPPPRLRFVVFASPPLPPGHPKMSSVFFYHVLVFSPRPLSFPPQTMHKSLFRSPFPSPTFLGHSKSASFTPLPFLWIPSGRSPFRHSVFFLSGARKPHTRADPLPLFPPAP